MNTAARGDDRTGAEPAATVTDPARIDCVFHALASRPRRDILTMLVESESDDSCCACRGVCSCDFAEKLGLSAPTVSYHMKTLVECGLVTSFKSGLWVHYRVVPEVFDAVMSEILRWSRTEHPG